MEENANKGAGESAPRAEKKDYLLPASILIAGLMVSGSVIYLVKQGSSIGRSPQDSLENVGAANIADIVAVDGRDVILGDPKAPVTIIEYGDYQCPFCGQKFFMETEPLIRAQYIDTGKVRMVYRNFAFLGPESVAAAEAAECAKDQKKFWSFHDEVYKKEAADGSEHNGNLSRDLFLSIAKDIGLDTETFKSCVDSGKHASVVEQELISGRDAGVDSTPTFFVNGQKIRGAIPFGDGAGVGSGFKSIIESALKNAK